MGRKRIAGLRWRNGVWHIQKWVDNRLICESTKTSDLAEAQSHLIRRLEEIRQAKVYGVRPARLFREAATKYLLEHQHKRSLIDDAMHLKQLDPFIGDLPLNQVHIGTLQPFIDFKRQNGSRTKSINNALGVVRRILNLSARLWRDEGGLTWLETPPLIPMLPVRDAVPAYPLSRDELQRLLPALPPHLARMTLFAVHTGLREQEICGLQWEWEFPTEAGSVFVLPGRLVKNGEDRLVVLNRVARSVVDEVRGQHPERVFTYQGKPVNCMNSTGWRRAWRQAGLPTDGFKHGVHNLRHTFGRWLRSAGVPLETRKVLLGHRNGDITTHYSAPEIQELIDAVERLCHDDRGKTVAKFALLKVVR